MEETRGVGELRALAAGSPESEAVRQAVVAMAGQLARVAAARGAKTVQVMVKVAAADGLVLLRATKAGNVGTAVLASETVAVAS